MSEIRLVGITEPSGVHFYFENGMVASVQFGRGNYCHHLKNSDSFLAASSVEIACWNKETNVDYVMEYNPTETDNWKGWVSIEEIPAFLEWCKNYKF